MMEEFNDLNKTAKKTVSNFPVNNAADFSASAMEHSQQRPDLMPADKAMVSLSLEAGESMSPREQTPNNKRADERTAKAVYSAVDQAQRTSNRSQASGLYMEAIRIADAAKDPSLQALAKVEYGLAHMSWGFPEEGFKWLLEAGANNPSLYNSKTNQSFLKRLTQAGIPQTAIDFLVRKGQQAPDWYINDPQATKKLDAAMTGSVAVTPSETTARVVPQEAQKPAAEQQQQQQQAGTWLKEQFAQILRAAGQEKNQQASFDFYKKAVDMADHSQDRTLQATARVELGLALISWGKGSQGMKWLLDAGAINPELYNNRVNQTFLERLKQAGFPASTIDLYISKGKQDANWHLKDANAAEKLEASLNFRPAAEAPRPFLVPYESPFSPQLQPREPAPPAPLPEKPRRPSPFK